MYNRTGNKSNPFTAGYTGTAIKKRLFVFGILPCRSAEYAVAYQVTGHINLEAFGGIRWYANDGEAPYLYLPIMTGIGIGYSF